LITMGSLSQEVAAAAEDLSSQGLEAVVAIVSNFHPDPEEDLAELLSSFRHVVSVEAQTLSGGLGAFVAGVIASRGISCKLRALGVRTPPDGTSGVQEERWRKHGIDRRSIVRNVHELVAR
jgi:transketolase C-terminal domain/subunit